jgi:hypothetical protein
VHFTNQDILNEESGITTINDFESENPIMTIDKDSRYTLNDASLSEREGVFLDHFLR